MVAGYWDILAGRLWAAAADLSMLARIDLTSRPLPVSIA